MNTNSNNLNWLVFLIRRAIAYSSIDKDYAILKKEAEKTGISSYSLYTLINGLNSPITDIRLDWKGFVRNEELFEEPADVNKTEQEEKTEQELPHISWAEWLLYVIGKNGTKTV